MKRTDAVVGTLVCERVWLNRDDGYQNILMDRTSSNRAVAHIRNGEYVPC